MISRSTLIGALVAVELAIVGMAASAIAIGPVGGPFAFHVPSFGRGAFASTNTLDRKFLVGPAPHVVIDVHDVPVVIEAESGVAVHAVESVSRMGFIGGTTAPITAQQTLDGVRLHTAGDSGVIALGSFDHSLHVAVPPAARVEILSADDVDASGLRAKLVVHSPDGVIHVSDHRGDLDLSSTTGRIVLTDVQGANVAANTRDGRLIFHRVAADRLDASTVNHYIEAVDLYAVDGALTTRDGHVNVSFTGDSDATVNVRTDNGKVHVHGLATTDDTRSSSIVHLGSGRGHFEVSTGDGTINITRGASTHA
jgi:hypothetical protein